MKHMTLGVLGQIALWLAVIGAVNWGLTAIGFNVVDLLTGDAVWLATVIYLLVGLAGIYLAIRAAMRERREPYTHQP